MKKFYRFILILGVVLFAYSNPVKAAPIHVALYDWYFNEQTGASGTLVSQSVPEPESWSYGDITSTHLVAEVTEKVFNDYWDSYNLGMFSWTVYNDAYFNPIMSFHVENGGILAQGWTMPSGWNFSQDNNRYNWWTDDDANGIWQGMSLNNMRVFVPTLDWTISNGNIDFYGEWVDDGIGGPGVDNWRVSHPAPVVPEPGTMFLLGSLASGLFGFAGLRRRFTK